MDDVAAGKAWRWFLPALLGSTAALKLFFAWRFDGFMTGDDLEIVESAAKYAVGLSYQPWGIRCLFHPLALVWPVMKAAALLGAIDPGVLSWTAAIPTALFSTAAIALVYALGRQWSWSPAAASAAAFLYAFHWLPLAYGSAPYPRPISAAMLVAAFLLASHPAPAWRVWAAGVLAGVAFAVRWSEGVILIPLMAWTAWRFRDPRRVATLAGGFIVGAFLSAGLFDWATYGSPFQSLRAFVQTMYLEIPTSRLAQEAPFYDYGWTILRWAGPVQVLLLCLAWKDRRSWRPSLLFLSIVALMSLFAHKEWRYLQSAVPFLALAAALGWERLRVSGRPWLAAAALLLASGWGVERAVSRLSQKSQPAIVAARFLRTLQPAPSVLALEQNWAYGNRLYLGNRVEIRDIVWQRPLTRLAIREAGMGADVVAVYADHLGDPAKEELKALGFRELAHFRKDAGRECVLYARQTSRPAEGSSPDLR
jgi:phosphatidylinositol glycan class B